MNPRVQRYETCYFWVKGTYHFLTWPNAAGDDDDECVSFFFRRRRPANHKLVIASCETREEEYRVKSLWCHHLSQSSQGSKLFLPILTVCRLIQRDKPVALGRLDHHPHPTSTKNKKNIVEGSFGDLEVPSVSTIIQTVKVVHSPYILHITEDS